MSRRNRPSSKKPQGSRTACGLSGYTATSSLLLAAQRATAAFERADWTEAERQGRLILGAKSNDYHALTLLGILAARTQRTQEALALLLKAISVCPDREQAHSNLGNVLAGVGHHQEALASYDRALSINPGYARAWNNRGCALRDLKRQAEALDSYDQALRIRSDYAEALNNRGVALRDLNRHEEALHSYDRALEIKLDYVDAFKNRGVVLHDLKRHTEALESYDRALELNPDRADTLNNRGVVLCDLKRPAEALESCDRALSIRPNYARALDNRGNALCDLQRYAEALESYSRAITLIPEDANAHWNLSLCRLRLGDFTSGWQEYEWRWKKEDWQSGEREFTNPLWLGGQPLEGKTILLHAEQGLGDTLQFCRYVPLVAALGAKVVLVVQRPLLPLLAGMKGAAQVLPMDAQLPAFDYHCPLLSLPLAFNTELDSIPACIPYLHSDVARVSAWQNRLGRKVRPRVGLVWSGRSGHRNDHNRSLALAEMLPLLSGHADWISLQKEVRSTDSDVLASRADIRHFEDELADFADTAALIESMDVVVTVDTSVAHLAGAMGKPVWILLPFNPDWRWLLERNDSPWYPSARLFRQAAIGNWSTVIDRVRNELADSSGAHRELRGRVASHNF